MLQGRPLVAWMDLCCTILSVTFSCVSCALELKDKSRVLSQRGRASWLGEQLFFLFFSVCSFMFVCVGEVEILTCDGSAGAGSSNSLRSLWYGISPRLRPFIFRCAFAAEMFTQYLHEHKLAHGANPVPSLWRDRSSKGWRIRFQELPSRPRAVLHLWAAAKRDLHLS